MGKLPFERMRRGMLIRRQAETTEKYGARPETRTVDELLHRGIVAIDKPAGPTSHQASDYVKKVLGLDKAGHSGTLDPHVTGVLPVALGAGTRIVQSLLTAGKEYVCVMHLHAELPEHEIRQAMKSFVGKIKQLPPVKSAIKRQWRFRKVYYIDILEITGKEVLFVVGCQAGTYIRKLCHDIGEKLGRGAHMAELRRTKAGPFDESQLVTLQDLADALHYYKKEGNEDAIRKVVQPLESGVRHLAKVWVLDSTVDALCNGVPLKVPGVARVETEIQAEDPIAVMTLKDELVLVGRSRMTSKEIQTAKKGIVVKAEQVFMQPGTYPKRQ